MKGGRRFASTAAKLLKEGTISANTFLNSIIMFMNLYLKNNGILFLVDDNEFKIDY